MDRNDGVGLKISTWDTTYSMKLDVLKVQNSIVVLADAPKLEEQSKTVQVDDIPEQTPEGGPLGGKGVEANQIVDEEETESDEEGPASTSPLASRKPDLAKRTIPEAENEDRVDGEDEEMASSTNAIRLEEQAAEVAAGLEPEVVAVQEKPPTLKESLRSASPPSQPVKPVIKTATVEKVEKRPRPAKKSGAAPSAKSGKDKFPASGTSKTPVNKHTNKNRKSGRKNGTPMKCLSKNNDLCATCGQGGDLICCDSCPRAFHLKCVRSLKGRVPRGSWACPTCQKGEERRGWAQGGDNQEAEAGLEDADREGGGGLLSLEELTERNEDPHQGVSLLCLLMYLELVVPKEDFLVIMKHVAAAADSPSSFDWIQSAPETLGEGRQSLNLLGLLRQIGTIIGDRCLVKLLRLLKSDLRPIATGFGLAPTFLEEGACWECGRLRFLRTACLQCGKAFDVSESIITLNLKNLKAGANHRRLCDRLADQLASEDQGPLSAAALVIPPESDTSKKSPKPSIESVLERVREGAIMRAIDYVHQCSLNPDDFRGFGGDMLFLLRNVTSMAVGPVKAHAKRLLHCIAKRWMATHPHMAEDAEADLILTSIEGMHALLQLGFAEDKSKALPDLLMDQETLQPTKKQKINSKSYEDKKSTGDPLEIERAETEDIAQAGTQNGPTAMDVENQGGGKDEEVLSQCSSMSTNSIAHSRKRRKSRSDTQGTEFHFETFRDELHKALKRFDVTDIMGFNPADGKIPYTPTEHCGHCGKTNVRGTNQCVDCDAYLKSKIDYGSLTDAVVWSYLFYEIGLSFDCHSGNISFTEVSQLLPQARCYKSVDEMGHDFFKLQCYFLTHFIYVCSNWGQHALRRELFAEEFEFILGNIKQVIRLDDPELVGEFVQCLRILQVTEERDPDIWPLVQQCMAYLIETERKKGSKGLFVSTTCPLYSRYHASYCGAVGLIDYVYLQPGEKTETPLPSCFMFDTCSDNPKGESP
mmetsp:Transcript_31529/g.40541  ORF Transcript_31529/g.40541 Transcript_31529/m.40541 type:complete len:984 (-) Transcript_31529:506-3457(-)